MEKQELISKNQRLIYYLAHKIGVMPDSPDYEDICSVGKIGLVKAAITFDPSKKIKFTSYAGKCIKNEIFMYFRKANKYVNDISLEEALGSDDEGNEITFKETLEDPESNFVDKIVTTEDFVQLIDIVLNCLESKERLVMLYRIGNLTQESIARKFKISRSYVSRIEAKSIRKIREIVNGNKCYKEVFSMSIQGENYKILLATQDKAFNKVFAALLEDLDSIEGIPKFEVTRNKERVVIRVSAHPESFSFVARIIQEMEDFSMVYSFDKKTMPIETNVSKEIKSDDYVYEEDYATEEISDESEMVYEESIEDESTQDEVKISEKIATDSELNEGLTSGRGSQVKLVREYMLSMERFTSMQLKEHFPMMSSTTIANAINLAKQKGLIKPIARGEYVVNKT